MKALFIVAIASAMTSISAQADSGFGPSNGRVFASGWQVAQTKGNGTDQLKDRMTDTDQLKDRMKDPDGLKDRMKDTDQLKDRMKDTGELKDRMK
jgi:hypothetical protein